MPLDEFKELQDSCCGLCGACDVMTTGISMCVIAEALGMSLTGNSSLSGVSPRLRQMAFRAGKQIMYLV